MNVAQCCTSQDLIPATIPIFGVDFPAAVCRSCGDGLVDEYGWARWAWKLFAPILELGWNNTFCVQDVDGLRLVQ